MKTLILTAVLAAVTTPVFAYDGWTSPASSRYDDCRPNGASYGPTGYSSKNYGYDRYDNRNSYSNNSYSNLNRGWNPAGGMASRNNDWRDNSWNDYKPSHSYYNSSYQYKPTYGGSSYYGNSYSHWGRSSDDDRRYNSNLYRPVGRGY